MRKSWSPGLAVLSALLLGGCGGSGSSAPGAAGAAQTEVVITTPAGFDNVALQVLIDLAGSAPQGLQSFPESAEEFLLEVFDAETGQSLSAPIQLLRNGQSQLSQQILGLSGRYLRVSLTARDDQGNFLGSLEQTLEVSSQNLEALFAGLVLPGPTREVGRISVSNDTLGFSQQPAISADGRFVAFASTASDIVPGVVNLTRESGVYLRDRALGTVRVLSSNLLGSTVADGTSNTIIFREARPATAPAMSSDATVVAFQVGGFPTQIEVVSLGSLFPRAVAITPASVPLGVQQVQVLGGASPAVSGDGRFVAYVASLPGLPTQIALFDRQTRNTLLVSKNSGGQAANGACTNPVLSENGRQIYFSTEANNLVGGQGGLVVHDLDTDSFVRLTSPSVHRCAVSLDQRFVAINQDGRLRLLDRLLNTNNEIPGLANFVIQGAPSMSGDARHLTFFSPREDLVSNDNNQRSDVFTIDRQTALISRVNVSGDGVSVLGGVGPDAGPVISRDGSRIAYSSPDPLLVPDDRNNNIDVFSAARPSGGILYALAPNGRIYRYDNVATAQGALAPTVEHTSALLGTGTPDLYLDTFNDRLYAATLSSGTTSRITLFERMSTQSPNLIQSRFRTFFNIQKGLFVDVGRNLLYRGNALYPLASTLGTTIEARQLPLTSSAILVDTRQQEWYVGSNGRVDVFPSAVTGVNTPLRFNNQLDTVPTTLQLDVGPVGSTLRNQANLMVFLQGAEVPQVPLAGNHRVSTFDTTLSQVRQALQGDNTQLGSFSLNNPPGPLVLDAYTGHGYANNGTDNRLLVFENITRVAGNQSPTRIIDLGFRPRAMVLDRTR